MHKSISYELNDYFHSPTRTLIWSAFFENPETEFYVRELEKKLKIQAAIVHRELKRMTSMKILVSRKFANLVLYKIDQNNHKLTQFRQVALKIYEARELLRTAVDNEKHIKVAFIYGPVAECEWNPDQSLDILIILSKEFSEDDYNRMKNKISEIESIIKLETSVDYWHKRHFLKKEQEEDKYLMDILDSEKVFIKGEEEDL